MKAEDPSVTLLGFAVWFVCFFQRKSVTVKHFGGNFIFTGELLTEDPHTLPGLLFMFTSMRKHRITLDTEYTSLNAIKSKFT